MAKASLVKGTTSYLTRIFIQDSSSTIGAGLSGLAFNTSGLKCYRARDDDGNAAGSALTLATATKGTWASLGFVEKDATNMKGVYEFGVDNAGLATGSKSVTYYFYGATNMAPLVLEFELTGTDNQDAVHGGMTALPNAAANAAGGLPISSAGALDLDEMNVDIEAIQAFGAPPTVAAIATGVWQDTTASDFTTALSIGKSVMNGVALGTGLTINAYTGNTPQTGDTYVLANGANGFAAIKTETAEIDSVTDQFVFTVANQVDCNVITKTGFSLSAAGVTAVWAEVMTGATTAVQAMRGFIAALLGKSSGLDVGTPTYRNIADSKNVITATADANGNRSVVTLDLT